MVPGSDIPWKAACASAGLASLFLVVYPFCNWVTSLRVGVPSFYFSWERSIPFVPWMIVPYLSIDAFFVLAPFLARTDRELFAYCRRMAVAILLCAACFLVFPLRCGFAMPHVPGILGNIFDHFRAVDLPYNECPSLHIAALMVLSHTYLRRLRGLARGAVAGWFLLIGISPLLIRQHHLVDIAAGLLLGALCLAFIGRAQGERRAPAGESFRRKMEQCRAA